MNRDSATRRDILIGSLAGGLVATLRISDACATPDTMRSAIHQLVGTAQIRKGRVELDVPRISMLCARCGKRQTADNHRAARNDRGCVKVDIGTTGTA